MMSTRRHITASSVETVARVVLDVNPQTDGGAPFPFVPSHGQNAQQRTSEGGSASPQDDGANRRRRTSHFQRLSVAFLTLLAPCTHAAETPPAPQPAAIDFYRDVYPVLKANCVSCHNKTTTKGDLNMESPELMKKGGESGPGIIAGKSAESLVWQAAAHLDADLLMPPKNNKSGAEPLKAAEVALFKAWIDQGAKHSEQQARQIAWQPLPPGVNPIYTAAMTKDGRYAACGRANQIFIYDLATRQLVTRLVDREGVAHQAMVQSLAFSPDGTRLASGSFREVKIWKMENDRRPASGESKPASSTPASAALLKQVAAAAKVEIVSHALSPDLQKLVVGCADGSVRIWDVAAAKMVLELRETVTSSRQASAQEWAIGLQNLEQSFQNAEVARIDAQNKALDELLKKANETIASMKKLLPEKENPVKPAQEAKTAAQKALEEVAALIAKAPDGKADAALDKQQKEAQEKLVVTTMAESSAVAAYEAVESNIKDAEADVQRITETKTKNVTDLAAANAAIVASQKALEQATAALAAVKQRVAQGGGKPLAVAFSPDGQKVSAYLADGKLQVWALASGTPMEELTGEVSPTTTTLTAAPDGTFTATKAVSLTTSAAPQWVVERTLGDVKKAAPFADRVNAVRFSPDGNTLAVGGGEPSRSGDVHLFDVGSGKLVQTWAERHSDAVLSVDFSPDGKLLASGGADKIARVTEVASGRQVNLFEGHTHHVLGVAFRADGRILASAGGDGVVLVWDMVAGERKKKIEGWTKEVTALQFVGATPQIVTSAGDNLIRIVSDSGTVVRAIDKLPDFMQAAASSANASLVIGGGEDSVLRLWDGTNGKELAVFESR